MSPTVLMRPDWNAQLPKRFSGWTKRPLSRIFLHHTVTGFFLNKEAPGMREIQNIAFGRGFNDISYSWAIFWNGVIAEARGWGVVGAHTQGYNSSSHAVVLVGNYTDIEPSEEQIESFQYLINDGIQRGFVVPHPQIEWAGHRDVSQTACPGNKAYAKLSSFKAPWKGEDDMGVEDQRVIIDHMNKVLSEVESRTETRIKDSEARQNLHFKKLLNALDIEVDVDEESIAAAVVATLDVRKLADSIVEAGVASAVVEELKSRL